MDVDIGCSLAMVLINIYTYIDVVFPLVRLRLCLFLCLFLCVCVCLCCVCMSFSYNVIKTKPIVALPSSNEMLTLVGWIHNIHINTRHATEKKGGHRNSKVSIFVPLVLLCVFCLYMLQTVYDFKRYLCSVSVFCVLSFLFIFLTSFVHFVFINARQSRSVALCWTL